MKIDLKYFALGAIIAAFPTIMYMKENTNFLDIHKSIAINHKGEYLNSETISQSLRPETAVETNQENSRKSQSTKVTEKEIAVTEKVTEIQPTIIPTYDTTRTQSSVFVMNRQHVPDEIQSLIDTYSNHYEVNRDMMLLIAKCESGYRNDAVNGPYAGIYQFLSSTWVSNRKAMQEDPDPQLRYSAKESIKTAAFKMSRDGFSAWPACSQKAIKQLSFNN